MAAVPHKACGVIMTLEPDGAGVLYNPKTGETFPLDIEGSKFAMHEAGWAFVKLGEAEWEACSNMFVKVYYQHSQGDFIGSLA